MKFIQVCTWSFFLLISFNSKSQQKNIDRFAELAANVSVSPNVVYKKVGNLKLEADVYYPTIQSEGEAWAKPAGTKSPCLIFFHGGGWMEGDKNWSIMEIMPYVSKGWVVVNANYRLLNDGAKNIADCIKDTRALLSWVLRNADSYGIDIHRIALSGDSAGGHLSLMTGMLPYNTTEFDQGLTFPGKPKIKAIINWYGVTNLLKEEEHWDFDAFKEMLIGNHPSGKSILKTASPITYISASCPPIFTIHGEKDNVVPVNQAIELHNALNKHQVKNKLIKVPGRKHGGFSPYDRTRIFSAIFEFLSQSGLGT